MSLLGSLNLGASALAAQQAALQVTGNNIANAGNADYARETATLTPIPDQQIGPGLFMGTGVDLTAVARQIDQSLTARLRSATSDQQQATTSQTWLSRVEATFNSLGNNNISTQMGAFFQSFSNLANTPQDAGLRQVVLQSGQSVAQSLTQERTQLSDIASDVQQQINTQSQAADSLATQIAGLNSQLVISSGGAGGSNNSILDQRDAALKKLASLVNIQTVNQPNGTVNVYVGSEPLVFGAQSSGVTVQTKTVNGQQVSTAVFKNTGAPLDASSGELGGLQAAQTQIGAVTAQVDTLAHNLISAVNNLHASGQGTEGITSATATNAVKDPTAALNSSTADLQFPPNNGSFVVHVTNKTTGLTSSTLVQVNLTGSAGDTTLNSLAASLNAISGVSATINAGKLSINATGAGNSITFSQDSSGVLASLGINTFFSGSDATNIAVNSSVANNPNLIAAAKNGDPGDNQTALAIGALNTQALDSLGGVSLQNSYQSIIDNVGGQVADANTNASATQAVAETLTAQQQSLSGVSLDEESINMLSQQRSYQGAALFLTTVNNMINSLFTIVQ